MSDRVIRLGGRSVRLAEPDHSSGAFSAPLIGRHRELRLVMAAWLAAPGAPPRLPVLIGHPGVGKTRIAYELARITARELYIQPGNDEVTADDLLVLGRDSDDPARPVDYTLTAVESAGEFSVEPRHLDQVFEQGLQTLQILDDSDGRSDLV